jgi:hypothetical protein
MTPNPTDQDVAALVAIEPVAWIIPGDDGARDTGFIDAKIWSEGEFTKPLYDAAALSTLAAERSENAKEALAAQGQADESYQRGVASEARATALEGERSERDGWVTHWQTKCQATAGLLIEANAQLARAREALERIDRVVTYPVATEISPRGYGIMPATSDSAEFIAEITREALRSPAPADGRGDQMLAVDRGCFLNDLDMHILNAARGTPAASMVSHQRLTEWRDHFNALFYGPRPSWAPALEDGRGDWSSNWRDIETAPKGERVLVKFQTGEVEVCYQTDFGGGPRDTWRFAFAERGRQAPWPVEWCEIPRALTAPDHGDVASQGGDK